VIEQQIGNYDHYRTQWDLSAPVKQMDGVAWRFTGAWTDSRFFRDFAHKSSLFFSPVITYKPSDWTEFTADVQYYSNVIRQQTGIPAVLSAPADVSVRRSYQEPNDPRDHTANFIGSYIFRQKLNENWTFDHRFLFSSGWWNQNLVKPDFLADDLSTLFRKPQVQNLYGRTFSTNFNLEGKFDTFGFKHNFLFGLDYLNRYFDYYLAENGFDPATDYFPINLYYPIYGTIPQFAFEQALIGTGFKFFQSNLVRNKGMYVQDQINFLDNRAHVLLGVRYDIADVTNAYLDTPAPECGDNFCLTKAIAIQTRLRNPTNQDTGWSPRYGVVFDVTPEVSVYGSFTRSFGANNAPLNGASRQAFPPTRGTQWEVGVKTQPLPGVTASLAFYQLTRSNLTTLDLSTPDIFYDQRRTGLQRSRGVEFDVIGALTDRLALVANYSYINAKVITADPSDPLKDPLDPFNGALVGNHLDNVPRHSGKLFLTYDFGENSLGWRVGGGVTGATRAWGDIQNTFLLPSWARLDAFASYTTLFEGHKVSAQLNLNNITNTRYFTGTDNFFNVPARFSAFPAAPFNVVGTLRFQW
ncbi:MAG: TonB-dependent receptor, partial [Methylocystis sp.]|nr:TonB-dependent receptor [Methylocystis sp.]